MQPLTPAVFQILLSLYDSDRHGYGIMQEIAERTNGEVVMGPGTLYGTLQRLCDARLVQELRRRDPSGEADERRRYYRLTPQGRRAAVGELERMRKLVADAQAKFTALRPRTT